MLEAILVGLVLLAAAAYLARYVWRATQGKSSGCGCGNGDCPKGQPHP